MELKEVYFSIPKSKTSELDPVGRDCLIERSASNVQESYRVYKFPDGLKVTVKIKNSH